MRLLAEPGGAARRSRLVAMLIVAQIPPDFLRRWTPWGYLAGLVLLVLVLVTKGEVGQGARRWLDLGIRFQPSEIMKLGRADDGRLVPP